MDEEQFEGIARILDADGHAVGGGVLLDSGEVLTTAHVLNQAAGAPSGWSKSRNGEVFEIDFPLWGAEKFEARVLRWASDKGKGKGDVATLEVLEPPEGIHGARFDPDYQAATDSPVQVFGFATGDAEGSWAEGTLRGRAVGDRVQIDQQNALNQLITNGYSGTPVWSEGHHLIGIVWGGRAQQHTVLMIPLKVLEKRLRVLPTEQGSAVWKVRHVVGSLATALLNDLVALEVDGLRPEQCAVVQTTLGRLNNELAALDEGMIWTQPPHEVVDQLEVAYRTWNGHTNGPEGAFRRYQSIKELRQIRRGLNLNAKKYATTLFEDRLTKDVDRIVSHFAPLPNVTGADGKTLFREVQGSIRDYHKGASRRPRH